MKGQVVGLPGLERGMATPGRAPHLKGLLAAWPCLAARVAMAKLLAFAGMPSWGRELIEGLLSQLGGRSLT